MEKIKVYDKTVNKHVTAGILHNGMFIRKVGVRNYCMKHSGYGLPTSALKQIKGRCKYVVIIGTASTRTTSFENWVNKGKKDNLGSGNEFFFPWLEMFTVKREELRK